MRNSIILLCMVSAFSLMNCTEKKAPVEKDAQKVPSTKIVDEGVVIAKQSEEDTLKGSLKAYTKGGVGEAEFKITYHSPAVRGRIVWGGLVPFDKVWVTGAHMATTIESNTDFLLDNKPIAAGKYGLFTIPGKEVWTVIINKNWEQHLTDEYDSAEDLARIVITPVQHPMNQERLMYEVISKSADELTIQITWEKVQLQIPISLNNPNFD